MQTLLYLILFFSQPPAKKYPQGSTRAWKDLETGAFFFPLKMKVMWLRLVNAGWVARFFDSFAVTFLVVQKYITMSFYFFIFLRLLSSVC